MTTKKKVFYYLCTLIVGFLIVLLNKVPVAEGRTIGLADVILKNAGLICILNLLYKYIRKR